MRVTIRAHARLAARRKQALWALLVGASEAALTLASVVPGFAGSIPMPVFFVFSFLMIPGAFAEVFAAGHSHPFAYVILANALFYGLLAYWLVGLWERRRLQRERRNGGQSSP